MVLKVYYSYNFRQKDPVIDELRTLLEDHHGERLKYFHFVDIEERGGPVRSTVRNLFWGKTRRPQSATIEAIGRSIGYQRTWTRMKSNGKGRAK